MVDRQIEHESEGLHDVNHQMLATFRLLTYFPQLSFHINGQETRMASDSGTYSYIKYCSMSKEMHLALILKLTYRQR